MAVQIAGVDASLDHGRMPGQRLEKADVGLQPGHMAVGQRLAQVGKCAGAVGAVHDQLGDHRVVEHADRITLFDAGIDAHLRRRRRQGQRAQRTGGGQEAGIRILGVEPHLDRVALLRDLFLRQRQRFAGGHAQLPFHQVQAGDHFGDRVLDLQPGVDLHEIEVAVRIDDELHGAGVDIPDRTRGGDRGLAHGRAQLRGQERGGRFLQHLLVAALGRAFALVEVDHLAVGVGEDLDLDVPRRAHVPLQQHAVAAEGVARLALAAFQRGGEVFRPVHHAHALAAAAMGGLDHQREAGARGLGGQQIR